MTRRPLIVALLACAVVSIPHSRLTGKTRDQTKTAIDYVSHCMIEADRSYKVSEGVQGPINALGSLGRARKATYVKLDANLFGYFGVSGNNAFCGVLIKGKASKEFLKQLSYLMKTKHLISTSTDYYSLDDPTEQRLAYWGSADANGLEGVLLATHKDNQNGIVTEVDYHIISMQ